MSEPGKTCDPSAGITAVDIAQAMAWASSKTLHDFCTDKDLKKLMCINLDGTPLENQDCVTWKKDDTLQTWREISKISTRECKTDKDCIGLINPYCLELDTERGKKNYCGFSSTRDSEPGRCEITTEEACNANSQIPYDCDDQGCKDKELKQKADIKNQNDCIRSHGVWDYKTPDKPEDGKVCFEDQPPYLEWRDTDQMVCGTEINQCKNPQNCKNGKCTCTVDDDCWGSGKCIQGVCKTGGRCVLGNFVFRKWCENPISRCQPDEDGKFPDECKGNSTVVGITDSPPFYYNPRAGQCYMTPEYCKRFNLPYVTKETQGCTSNSDCPSGLCDTEGTGKCISDLGKCDDGPFSKGVPAYFASMAIGNTLFSILKNKGKCSSESYEWLDLNKIPDEIKELIDTKFILEKELIHKDLVPGINLYLLHWSRKKVKNQPIASVGFIGTEIKKKYPSLIKKQDGVQFLCMKKKNLTKEDKEMKRIYFYAAKQKDILRILDKKAEEAKLTPEERNFILGLNKLNKQ